MALGVGAVVDDSLGWHSLWIEGVVCFSANSWPLGLGIFSADPEEGDGLLGLVDLRLAGMDWLGWYWSAVDLKMSSILWSGTLSWRSS